MDSRYLSAGVSEAASLSPLLVRGDFSALYERVRKSEVNNVAPIPDGVERICCGSRHGLHLVLEKSALSPCAPQPPLVF